MSSSAESVTVVFTVSFVAAVEAAGAADADTAAVGLVSVTLLNESHFIYMWHFCGSDYDTLVLYGFLSGFSMISSLYPLQSTVRMTIIRGCPSSKSSLGCSLDSYNSSKGVVLHFYLIPDRIWKGKRKKNL